MPLRIRTRELDFPATTRQAIERWMRLTLGRQTADLAVAPVTPAPGLAGRPDSRCRIRWLSLQGGSLAIEDQAEDAVSAASRRLEQRLERRRFVQHGTHERRLGLHDV